MLRVLLPVLTLMLLLMAVPAAAIPICPSGTMADYIAFGSTGCNLNNLTFLNFSYSGGVRAFSGESQDFFGSPVFPSPPPSAISVLPRSNLANLGSGGAALAFSPPHLQFGSYWGGVNVSFEVFARTGPGIVGDTLSAHLHSVADLQSGFIGESAVPGGGLSRVQSFSLCSNHPPFLPPPPPSCEDPASLSIPFTRFQEIDISGFNVDSFEAGFATPEPATLLLVGTGAAGVGLARWWKRRRGAL
jgi:hypothetical protein